MDESEVTVREIVRSSFAVFDDDPMAGFLSDTSLLLLSFLRVLCVLRVRSFLIANAQNTAMRHWQYSTTSQSILKMISWSAR